MVPNFELASELAATIGSASPVEIKAATQYGYNLGMAFQLVDDVLDFTGNSETLGKPSASDLREGKATLAVIERQMPGLSEAMRAIAHEETRLALLDRGVAGVRGRTLIVVLPTGRVDALPGCRGRVD